MAVQLMNFITNLKWMCSEMQNGTYSHRYRTYSGNKRYKKELGNMGEKTQQNMLAMEKNFPKILYKYRD